MGRRRRRHDADWTPVALMGLAALLGLLRGRRGAEFAAREMAAPFRPVFTIVALVEAFVALGVLLTVLSAVAALGGGGLLAVACGVPALFVAFIAWVISQRPKQASARIDGDAWTTDGAVSESSQAAVAEAGSVMHRTATVGDEGSAGQPTAKVQRRDAAHDDAARGNASRTWPAAKAQAIPERPPRSPAEYRQRAVSYRRKIQSLIKMRRPGPIAERMTGVLAKLKSWEERVGQLADRLTLYEKDDLIQRDVRETPMHIERLSRQLALEAEPEMQLQVRRTLAAYEEQQRQLGLLARVMKRTRLNLDDTLAAMGTVYSQLQVLNAMDIDGPTATRIAGDVDREIERLNDLLAAMSDVYGQGSEKPRQPAVDDEEPGLSNRNSRLSGTSAT